MKFSEESMKLTEKPYIYHFDISDFVGVLLWLLINCVHDDNPIHLQKLQLW